MALIQARKTGEFVLSEAPGTLSREEVTIDLSAGALVAGTVMSKLTASGKWVAYDDAGTDGSEVASGVLYAAVPDSAADQKGVIIARQAEVAQVHLTGYNANAKVDLAAVGIIVR